MGRRKLRIAVALALAFAGGSVFVANGAGCASFAGETVLGSVDFCFLFDCVDGAIGGLLDPCSDVGRVNPQFMNRDVHVPNPIPEGAATQLFIDCPSVSP